MLSDFSPILLNIGLLLLLLLVNLADPFLVVFLVTIENLLGSLFLLLRTHSYLQFSFHEWLRKNILMMNDLFMKLLQSLGFLQLGQLFLILNHLLQMFISLSAKLFQLFQLLLFLLLMLFDNLILFFQIFQLWNQILLENLLLLFNHSLNMLVKLLSLLLNLFQLSTFGPGNLLNFLMILLKLKKTLFLVLFL